MNWIILLNVSFIWSQIGSLSVNVFKMLKKFDDQMCNVLEAEIKGENSACLKYCMYSTHVTEWLTLTHLSWTRVCVGGGRERKEEGQWAEVICY